MGIQSAGNYAVSVRSGECGAVLVWTLDHKIDGILYNAGGGDKTLRATALASLSNSKLPVLALYGSLISEGL